MLKRNVMFILIFVISISLIACSNTLSKDIEANRKADEIVSPEPEKEQSEITIVIETKDYINFFKRGDFLSDYKNTFEDEFEVKVNLEKISIEKDYQIQNYASMTKEVNRRIESKLSSSNGPELIFYNYVPYDALINQKAFIDIKDKIPNIEKIYEKLLEDEMYNIPIGIMYESIVLNKKILDELRIDTPSFDWTKEDYLEIREKWLKKNNIKFFGYEYVNMLDVELSKMDILNKDNRDIKLNTPEMKRCIRDVRDKIFSGRYILNNSYNYENYHNMLFESQSEEYEKETELASAILDNYEYLKVASYGNALNTLTINNINKYRFGAALPQFEDEVPHLESFGFLINKNGKNIELAIEFLNGLLSNDIQMKLYKDGFNYYPEYYPVNREIEKEIRNFEAEQDLDEKAIALKEHVLDEIKSKEIQFTKQKDCILENKLFTDLSKFIFADKSYNDEELSKELERLEEKYKDLLKEY